MRKISLTFTLDRQAEEAIVDEGKMQLEVFENYIASFEEDVEDGWHYIYDHLKKYDREEDD